jgi:aromatic-amino-acid transaminase
VILPKLQHLFLRQRKHREHPEVAADEGKARIRCSDPLTDGLDALAHGCELDQPTRMKLRILEDDMHRGRAMIGRQFGMFSMLPLSKEQVLKLREDEAIYMADSGRFNVVGMGDNQIDRFIAAVVGALDA